MRGRCRSPPARRAAAPRGRSAETQAQASDEPPTSTRSSPPVIRAAVDDADRVKVGRRPRRRASTKCPAQESTPASSTISPASPVSSVSSRSAASRGSSPKSTPPPGSVHMPSERAVAPGAMRLSRMASPSTHSAYAATRVMRRGCVGHFAAYSSAPRKWMLTYGSSPITDRVVTRADLEQVAGPDLEDASVVHLDAVASRQDEPDVRDLAAPPCPARRRRAPTSASRARTRRGRRSCRRSGRGRTRRAGSRGARRGRRSDERMAADSGIGVSLLSASSV